MIISTTGIEGKKILEYKGIVFGEVVAGVNMFKDMAAGFRNIFGGRASSYEGELTQAREEALAEMMARASDRGANAIIGVKMDYETLGSENGMLMVTCSGTVVVLESCFEERKKNSRSCSFYDYLRPYFTKIYSIVFKSLLNQRF